MTEPPTLLPPKLQLLASSQIRSSQTDRLLFDEPVTLIAASGSVLDYQAGDCIVNAANRGGITGFGLDEMVNRAGGPALKEARRAWKGIPTGTAKSTPSFDLAHHVPWIIHAVGPVFRNNALSHTESIEKKYALLQSAYYHAMKEAATLQCRDIAFSLLSCGVFRGEEPLDKLIGAGIQGFLQFYREQLASVEGEEKGNTQSLIHKVVLVGYTLDEQAALTSLFKRHDNGVMEL